MAVTNLRKAMATPGVGTCYTAMIHGDDTLRFWGDFELGNAGDGEG